MNLLPEDDSFFDLLRRQLLTVCQASDVLVSGLRANNLSDKLVVLSTLEAEGDEILRQTMYRLQQTFITPFEPEEVQSLTRKLDDVLDLIEEAGFLIVTYRFHPIPAEIAEIGGFVRDSCGCLQNGLRALTLGQSALIEGGQVAALESRAEALSRRLLSDLFQ